MEAEGDKHGRPVTIGCTVPGTIPRVAVAIAVLVNFEVQFTFCISHLHLCNAHKVLAQIPRVWITSKHALPVQLCFNICRFICIAFDAVDMFFNSTLHF